MSRFLKREIAEKIANAYREIEAAENILADPRSDIGAALTLSPSILRGHIAEQRTIIGKLSIQAALDLNETHQ